MPHPILTNPINPLIPHGPADVDFQTVLVQAMPGPEDTEHYSFLTHYDLAMREWLRAATVWNGRIVPVVFAAPLRAFSTYRQLLTDGMITPLDPPVDADLNFAKPPLPFISYTRGDFKPGLRQNQNYPVRNIAFLDGTNKRRTGYTRYPMSVVIPYTVEIWTKTFQAQTFIVQRLLTQFWPKIAYWQVTTPFIDNLLMPIKLGGISDTSQLEGGADGERSLRMTFSLEVEGQMFFDLMQAPTFLRERDEIGTAQTFNPTTGEIIDKTINIDLSIDEDNLEGLAGPSTDAINALPKMSPTGP